MTLGDIIKEYRVQNSVTMEYAASLCGITKGYVAMLERNVNPKTGRPVKPTIETILKVCNGLNLDVNEVFDRLDDDYIIAISSANKKLSMDEQRLLSYFRKLNSTGQEKVSTFAIDLVDSGKYSPTIEQIGVIHDSSKGSDEFISVLAAHHDGEWTDEELDEVREIKEYAKMKNNK